MACERFRDALTDVAAGAPAPAGVEAHLATCEACRAELDALRQALAVADVEMAGVVAAEPSPELGARIRQVVAEAEPSPAWRLGWVWPATAAAATLLVALAVWVGRTPPPEPRVAVDAGRPVIPRDVRLPGDGGEALSTVPGPSARRGSAIPADPSSPGSSSAPRDDRSLAVGHRPPGVPTRAVRVAAPAEPEVLVPPGEEQALLRLVALVHRERHAPAAFLAAGQPSTDLAEPAALDIKPLEIVPLEPAETSGT